MGLDALYWREPLWLCAALVPWALFLLDRILQRHWWRKLADAALLPWVQVTAQTPGQGLTRAVFVLAWVLFSVALAGPRTPGLVPPALQTEAASVVAVVDFSASMRAQDERLDRIERSRALLQRWLETAPSTLRLGLVIYAGHAYTIIRPTADHALLHHYLGQLDSMRPPTAGNNLSAALQLAAGLLEGAGGVQRLVVFSDGDMDEVARRAAETVVADMTGGQMPGLYLIGVGGDEPVGVPRLANEPLIIDGKYVVSRRNEGWLRQLAVLADASYRAIENLQKGSLSRVLDIPEPRISPEASAQVLWDEWFFIPLLAGLLLILTGLLPMTQLAQQGRHVMMLVLVVLLGACQQDPIERLRADLAASRYAEARVLAETLDGYHARYAEGIACYRLADYPCALQAFSRAAWIAPDAQLRGRAAFNLGNTHFRLGDYEEASVLFNDARQLGVASELTEPNLEFANSLMASVRQQLADITETERRARWRAEAQVMPEEFSDRIAEGIYLSRPKTRDKASHVYQGVDVDALVAQGIRQVHSAGGDGRTLARRSWVAIPQQGVPEQTAGLFNRLMPMEAGIPYVPEEPLHIDGQRPW